MYSNIWNNYVVFWLLKMTFHNIQNSLIYRLKTQEIACQRLCISKFSQGASLGPPSAFSRRQQRSPPVLNSSLRASCTPSVIKWYLFCRLFFSRAPYYLPSNEVPPKFEKPGDACVYSWIFCWLYTGTQADIGWFMVMWH